MNIVLRQTTIQAIRLPTTEGAFPVAEAVLRNNPVLCADLEERLPSCGYRSVLDWLVCVCFEYEIKRCLAFYNEGGPRLRCLLTPVERRKYEEAVLSLMDAFSRLAWKWYQEKERSRP